MSRRTARLHFRGGIFRVLVVFNLGWSCMPAIEAGVFDSSVDDGIFGLGRQRRASDNTGRPVGGADEGVEGCFAWFDSEFSVLLGRENLNNKRCQAICTNHAYALAATGANGTTCFCGNNYPASVYRVATIFCNLPCNPDKASCFAYTCCGNSVGTAVTVSWSGEVDVTLQLLRKLTYDYRNRAPTFRRKIEGMLNNRAVLQSVEATEGGEVVDGPLYLSAGECPVGWVLFQSWCYKLHWAQPSTMEEAVAACRADGGADLASITSVAENMYVKQLLDGCQGWINSQVALSDCNWSAAKAITVFANRKLSEHEPGLGIRSFTNGSAPVCFEMVRNGSWVAGSCYKKKTRVVVCERGASGSSCNCHSADSETKHQESWQSYSCKCYIAIVVGGGRQEPLNWLEAQAKCGTLGGRLVTIGSNEENSWVLALTQATLTFNEWFVPAYIGLNNLLERSAPAWTYFKNWQARTDAVTWSAQHVASARTNWTQAALAGQLMARKEFKETGLMSSSAESGRDMHQQAGKQCARMMQDGSWVATACGQDSKASCFVCKRCRGATSPGLRPHDREEWDVEVIDENKTAATFLEDDKHHPYPWCADCHQAYLRHVKTGFYLGVDVQNWPYLSTQRDPAWCLFILVVDVETGRLAIMTRHGAVLCRRDGSFRGLLASGWEATRAPPFQRLVSMNPDALVLQSSPLLRDVARRYLRIAVAVQPRDDTPARHKQPVSSPRACSMAAYDTTPRSVSYTCTPLEGQLGTTEGDGLVTFQQTALLIHDSSRWYTPLEPLVDGRVRCLNRLPVTSAQCVFAYSTALILTRRFRAQWGYIIFDTVIKLISVSAVQRSTYNLTRSGAQPRAGLAFSNLATSVSGPFGLFAPALNATSARPGNFATFQVAELKSVQNAFTGAYNAFYQISIVELIISARTSQLFAPVPPLSAVSIQFWLTTERVLYRWRALLEARGGFIITVFGQQLGSLHSLGDLTDAGQLEFLVFGEVEEPVEAEIFMVVEEDNEMAWLGLPVPEADREGGYPRNFLSNTPDVQRPVWSSQNDHG